MTVYWDPKNRMIVYRCDRCDLSIVVFAHHMICQEVEKRTDVSTIFVSILLTSEPQPVDEDPPLESLAFDRGNYSEMIVAVSDKICASFEAISQPTS